MYNIQNMKTPDKPPLTGGSDDDWRFWENIFSPQVAPYPTEHLIGRVALEDRVAAAEQNFEHGHELNQEDIELLRLSQEIVIDHLDD